MRADLFRGDGHFSMLRTEEIVAAMPLCQEVGLAGTRDLDFRTPLDPAGAAALAEALAQFEVTR